MNSEIEVEVPEMPPFRAKKDVTKRRGEGSISDERLYAQEHEEPQEANRASAWGSELERSGEADAVACNIRYEMGDRMRGLSVGGIGMMHQVARRTGLIEAIDKDVHVLKRHLPYQESDHVLNCSRIAQRRKAVANTSLNPGASSPTTGEQLSFFRWS